MTIDWKSPGSRDVIWPVAGIALGALVATNPSYKPHITLAMGMAAWFLSLILALILSLHPVAARVGVLVIGLFFAVPCFLREPPLSRGLLMCFMALPFAIVALPICLGPSAGFRERLIYLCTWLGTRQATRRARSFDAWALLRLIIATAVLAAGAAGVKGIPPEGLWLILRWLSGGIMILALAEMVTACHDFVTAAMGLSAAGLMRSPHLSTSISEFWAERWNPAASVLFFHKYCFLPFARRGIVLALCIVFFFSALAHFLGAYMAFGTLKISLLCGAFFLVQPVLIGLERRMKVRRWRRGAQHAWTLTALAVTSPLFVECALQLLEPSWGPPGYVLLPTLAVLMYVVVLTVFFAIGFLVFGCQPAPSNESLQARTAASSS